MDVDEAYRYAYKSTRAWARRKGVEQDPMKKSGNVTGVMTMAYYRDVHDGSDGVTPPPPPPGDWASEETRRVRVSTPDGEMLREILLVAHSKFSRRLQA